MDGGREMRGVILSTHGQMTITQFNIFYSLKGTRRKGKQTLKLACRIQYTSPLRSAVA